MILKNFIVKNRKTVDNFFFFFALIISKSDLSSINKRSINLYLKFSLNKIQKLYPKPLLINRLISRIFVIFFRRSLNDNKKNWPFISFYYWCAAVQAEKTNKRNLDSRLQSPVVVIVATLERIHKTKCFFFLF